ncbi:MAG: hypothetical protein IPK59_08720 [Rhodospirillaceae bacterium]|nr:hypothetical protein [Rhodospirillaceae bacterium]
MEDTTGTIEGVEPLDLLSEGREISLRPDSGLIISYLDSCQRENIRGGKIVIGKAQSDVTDGNVSRKRISCDPAALALTPEQANQSATLVFRPAPLEDGVKFVMGTRRPVVIAGDLKDVLIEDLRKPGTTWSVVVVNGVADLTADRRILDRGGHYRLVGGGRTLVFQIGLEATDAPLPLLLRVIRF